MLTELKHLLKRNWIFYLAGLLIILRIKYFYSNASADDLTWILTPTARWVRFLSGIAFEWEKGVGYVNHTLRFIIAPSCSGVQFMIISIAVMIFSFIHHMDTKKKGFCWIAFSLLFSYLFTILVNGIRITLSIYLPISLAKTGALEGWLTHERLHTLLGTVIYFTALLLIYYFVGTFFKKLDKLLLSPLFWYLFIVLGMPFLNKAYQNNQSAFTEYTFLVTGMCAIISILVFALTSLHKNHYKYAEKREL